MLHSAHTCGLAALSPGTPFGKGHARHNRFPLPGLPLPADAAELYGVLLLAREHAVEPAVLACMQALLEKVRCAARWLACKQACAVLSCAACCAGECLVALYMKATKLCT